MSQETNDILAEGEATGHAHRTKGNHSKVVNNILFAPEGTTITHEEHKHLTLPAGNYEILRVQEYDHWAEEARIVRD